MCRTHRYCTYFDTREESALSWPSLASALTAKCHVPRASPSIPTLVKDACGSDKVREYEPEFCP
jgi:hypothetical protein